MSRFITLLLLSLMLTARSAAPGQAPAPDAWLPWEGFDAQVGEDFRPWKAEDWPASRGAALLITDARSAQGRQSAQAELTMVGWAGAIRALKMKPMPSTPQEIRVSIFCEPKRGATEVPVAKLEVYRADNGEAMDGLDTPLVPYRWTEVVIPAGKVTATWDGVGVVFFPGHAKGSFRVNVDDLRIGTETWEGFEAGLQQRVWEGEGFAGPHEVAVVGDAQAEIASKPDGRCCRIEWSGDTDGIEVKHHAPRPIDLSAFRRLKLKAATAAPRMTVSLWLWDGAKGHVVPPDQDLTAGGWKDVVYDLSGAQREVNLCRTLDVGFVMTNYAGGGSTVYLDSLLYSSAASAEAASAEPQWSRYDERMAAEAMERNGSALVYVRSANTDFCQVFERTYLFPTWSKRVLAKHPLFFVETSSQQGQDTAKRLGVMRVPALILLRRGGGAAARLQVAQNTSQQEILAFVDSL